MTADNVEAKTLANNHVRLLMPLVRGRTTTRRVVSTTLPQRVLQQARHTVSPLVHSITERTVS